MSAWGRALCVALALLALVSFSTALRIHGAFQDPNFDRASSEGMLKSDPALLYYLVERFLAADGAFPGDLRADPRIQWPDETDVPAELGVGQEPLVAWTYPLLGRGEPLHVYCVRSMALVASLTTVGVFLAAFALARSVRAGLLAAALFAVLPANYRTVGFILVREDIALPLFALHLAALAWTARSLEDGRARWTTGMRSLVAGTVLAAALSTWHALVFVAALEAAVFLTWFLRSGKSPFRVPGTVLVLVPLVLAALFVPLLRRSGFLLSIPMLVGLALLAAALFPRTPRRSALAALLALVLLAWGIAQLGPEERGAYAHVFDLVRAKLAHGGVLPVDPDELSFDARLLWQGPFETLAALETLRSHPWVLLLAVPALVSGGIALARGDRAGEALLALGLLAALASAWWIERTLILFGLIAPLAIAVTFARLRWRRSAFVVQLAAIVLQFGVLQQLDWDLGSPWYRPPGRQREIAELVRFVRAKVPLEEPIVGDFMNSPALLAQCGNPIALQPKYETDASRRKAEVFLETFFFGTPRELAELVRGRFESRYLLVDRYTLGVLSRYAAGLAEDEPLPVGSAAAVFLGQDDAALAAVPGFELVYRSPPTILQANGAPYDFFRLYRVE